MINIIDKRTDGVRWKGVRLIITHGEHAHIVFRIKEHIGMLVFVVRWRWYHTAWDWIVGKWRSLWKS